MIDVALTSGIQRMDLKIGVTDGGAEVSKVGHRKKGVRRLEKPFCTAFKKYMGHNRALDVEAERAKKTGQKEPWNP